LNLSVKKSFMDLMSRRFWTHFTSSPMILKVLAICILIIGSLIGPQNSEAKITRDLLGALSLVNQSPYGTGPNCWNFALKANGLNFSLRGAEPEEFQFFLDSPLCQRVESRPQAGDIGSFAEISKEGTVVSQHGFIYLTDKWALSKNGANVLSHYQVLPIEKLKQVRAYTPPGYVIQTYRCISITRWTKSNLKGPNQILAQKTLAHLEEFEAEYQRAQEKKYRIPIKTIRSFFGRVRENRFHWRDSLSSQDPTFRQNELLFAKIMGELLTGLSGQFYYTHGDPVMTWFAQEGKDWSFLGQ
jgi:hypothetical protein